MFSRSVLLVVCLIALFEYIHFFPLVFLDQSVANSTIPPIVERVAVFESSDSAVYRIPSLIVDGDSLFAFSEKRVSLYDPGRAGEPISIVFKQSFDLGRSWSNESILASDARYDYSDPRALVKGNKLILFYTRWPDDCGQRCTQAGDDRNALLYRIFDGVSWGAEVDVSASVKSPDMKSINAGPGIGVDHRGRLLFPATARDANDQFRAFSVYSDDLVSWHRGEYVPTPGGSENDLVSVGDSLILTSRVNDPLQLSTRAFFLSNDDGLTWQPIETADLGITRVDASLVFFDDCLFFVAPSSNEGRFNLSYWKSCGNTLDFGYPYRLVNGPSAYSAAVPIDYNSIGVLYEADQYKSIKFLVFDVF